MNKNKNKGKSVGFFRAATRGARGRTPGPPVLGRDPADLRFRLPVAGNRGVITGAAGTLASTFQVLPSTFAPNWSSLQGEFDEYRVLGATIKLSAISAFTGVGAVWLDENDATAPTPTEANQRPHRLISLDYNRGNGVIPSSLELAWRAQNYNELTFIPMSTGVLANACFKFYTDTANYGAQNAAITLYFEVWYDIEFRGLGGDA